MKKTALVFEAARIGYEIDQVADRAMTVGDLMEFLETMDEEDVIVISHDNGFTYGSLEFVKEVS